MKIENYNFPKSSFLSVEKDFEIIVDRICQNKRLQKLLYYTTPDCLSKPNLTDEQLGELLQNNIKLVPKLKVEDEYKVYLFIRMDTFTQNITNPWFRDNIVEFDIVCNYDLWSLDGYSQRPYKILGELDYMFADKRLTGIGTTEFFGASELVFTDQLGGYCLMYKVVHGDEDKKHAPNPADEQDFLLNFNQIYNP